MQDGHPLPDDVPVADAVDQQRESTEEVLDEEVAVQPPADPPLEASRADWQEQLEVVEIDDDIIDE